MPVESGVGRERQNVIYRAGIADGRPAVPTDYAELERRAHAAMERRLQAVWAQRPADSPLRDPAELLTLAAAKLGAVCMPVNWRLAPGEVQYIVDHGMAKLMMADKAFLPLSQSKCPLVKK